MICLNIERLSFSFGTKRILNNATFSLDETDKLGIIGVNGCGKSTLFKIILGENDVFTLDELLPYGFDKEKIK